MKKSFLAFIIFFFLIINNINAKENSMILKLKLINLKLLCFVIFLFFPFFASAENSINQKQMLKKIHTMEILEVLMEDKVSLHINS